MPVREPAPASAAPSEMLVTLTKSELATLITEAVTLALDAHTPPTAPELLTQSQLAQALGCSVSTVYALRQRGLPSVWLLDSPRFVLAEVMEWVRAQSSSREGDDTLEVSSNDSAELDTNGKTTMPVEAAPIANRAQNKGSQTAGSNLAQVGADGLGSSQ